MPSMRMRSISSTIDAASRAVCAATSRVQALPSLRRSKACYLIERAAINRCFYQEATDDSI